MRTLPNVKAYDAVVVGMGPAGAIAAYQLSRAGLSVLGLDKATHPRYKVCGGGLSVRIDRILEDEYTVRKQVGVKGMTTTDGTSRAGTEGNTTESGSKAKDRRTPPQSRLRRGLSTAVWPVHP